VESDFRTSDITMVHFLRTEKAQRAVENSLSKSNARHKKVRSISCYSDMTGVKLTTRARRLADVRIQGPARVSTNHDGAYKDP